MNTSEQLKAEAIRKAWISEIGDEKYRNIQAQIDEENGMAPFRTCELHGFDFTNKNLVSPKYGYLVPESLHGIENNNGWTRIEPDGSNLPTDERFLKSFDEQTKYNFGCFSSNGTWCLRGKYLNGYALIKAYNNGLATHFKTLQKELEPIF